jgi:nicotinamidase-related amidase
LLIIDVNYNFTGDKPEPILDSIKRFPFSCGEEGWASVYKIRDLIGLARKINIPIIYTTGDRRKDNFDSGRWRGKVTRFAEGTFEKGHLGTKIVEEIKPDETDIVIVKKKPSAFFGTPLMSYLNELKVDTTIICGTTTSGCVRATVIDAFSYNFRVVVVEECVFDRGEASHKINLCDMHMKYGDVVPISEVEVYLKSLPEMSYKW